MNQNNVKFVFFLFIDNIIVPGSSFLIFNQLISLVSFDFDMPEKIYSHHAMVCKIYVLHTHHFSTKCLLHFKHVILSLAKLNIPLNEVPTTDMFVYINTSALEFKIFYSISIASCTPLSSEYSKDIIISTGQNQHLFISYLA